MILDYESYHVSWDDLKQEPCAWKDSKHSLVMRQVMICGNPTNSNNYTKKPTEKYGEQNSSQN